MPLPQIIRVKLSSEAAGAISVTPVVAQDLEIRELIEHMLWVVGKDEARIRELLRRGSLVSGASRFRWAGWQTEPGELADVLAAFPDPDPSLPFDAGRCVRMVLRGGLRAVEIPRDAVEHKRRFWDALMQAAEGAAYSTYSYRDRADRYVRRFAAGEIERLRAAAEEAPYSTMRDQMRMVAITEAHLYVPR